MDFGLRQQDVAEIIGILQRFSVVEQAIIFGSRAKGTFKKGSDVDIAVKGKGVDHEVVASLSFLLNEESAMPYFFDLVHFEGISEKALRDHINRVGKCFYSRGNGAGAALAGKKIAQGNKVSSPLAGEG